MNEVNRALPGLQNFAQPCQDLWVLTPLQQVS